MFGMGFTEIFLIAVVAIIALGPEKLPTAMVEVAKFFKKVKGQITEVKQSVEDELRMSELKSEALEYKKKLDNAIDDVKPDLSMPPIIDDDIADILREKDTPKVVKQNHSKNRYSDEGSDDV